MIAAELELDLEVFTGPFDLLLTLVLREEVDLLEVELADVVVSYLDVLEARGELDLEVATEFLVLIAALLELKSRLMLPRDDAELLEDLEPGEAAEELLARMLDARRYRRAAEHLTDLLAARARPSLPVGSAAGLPASRPARRVGAPSTTRRSSAPRSAGCCACRRRSTSATWAPRESPSASASTTCARCCAAAASRSTRRSSAPIA